MFDLKGKNVIVTGGGSGIGKAIAKTFGDAAAVVRIIELKKDSGDQTANEIKEKGGKASAYEADVSQQEQVVQVAKRVIEEDGKIDVLVACAGIAHVGTLGTTAPGDLDRIYNVNVKGVYNSMFAVIDHMEQQGNGVILNIASIASHVGIADRFAYSMSKGAVYTMTQSVAKDYVKKGIRCNSVSPARVHTPFVDGFIKKNYPGKEEEMFEKLSLTQPIGRMATPEDVASLALYLCSDDASFITGTDYPIDGGFITLNS